MKAILRKADDIPGLIKDGDTIATVGMTLAGASESILKALEQSFWKRVPHGILLWFIPPVRVTEKMASSISPMKAWLLKS